MTAYLKIDHVDKTFTPRFAPRPRCSRTSRSASRRASTSRSSAIPAAARSTLLNIVAGLTPSTTGGVLLENREVNEPGPDRAVVFQNHSLLPWLTVYDNVRLAVDKVFAGQQVARRAPRLDACTISISCRWRTPRTSGRRRSPAA